MINKDYFIYVHYPECVNTCKYEPPKGLPVIHTLPRTSLLFILWMTSNYACCEATATMIANTTRHKYTDISKACLAFSCLTQDEVLTKAGAILCLLSDREGERNFFSANYEILLINKFMQKTPQAVKHYYQSLCVNHHYFKTWVSTSGLAIEQNYSCRP